jgi:hypothetical protein
MPFTSVDRCKRLLQIPGAVTQHDVLLAELVAEANTTILSELRLSAGMTEATYYEVLSPEYGDTDLMLWRMPVQSITALTDASTGIGASAFYAEKNGRIRLKDGRMFGGGVAQVAVTYRAGFTTTDGLPPSDLAHAATLIVARDFNAGPYAGQRSSGMGPSRVDLDAEQFPPAVNQILNRYRVHMI